MPLTSYPSLLNQDKALSDDDPEIMQTPGKSWRLGPTHHSPLSKAEKGKGTVAKGF